MKFMLLFHIDEKRSAELSKAENDRILAECDQLALEYAATGRAGGCAALEPSSTARTLRLCKGQLVITDGPFAETKEVLAGVQILDCRDINHALEMAAKFPPLCHGASVEVRPIRGYSSQTITT